MIFTADTTCRNWTRSAEREQGREVIRKYKTELPKIQELASRENPDALFHLGLMHYEGWGIPQNYAGSKSAP